VAALFLSAAPPIRVDVQNKRRDSSNPGNSTQIDAKTSQCARRILVLCLGGIGDTVLAFAALRDLRAACPSDHLTALAMWPQSADLLRDLHIFDEVVQHNFQHERLWRSLLFTCKQRWEHHDVSLLAFPANRFEYNAASWLLGAKQRFGHTYLRGGATANLRFLLNGRIAQCLGRHNVDENRALVAAFTGVSPSQPADIRLGPLDPRYHDDATRIFKHLHEPLIGIHAGSSTFKGLETKRWPAQMFGELCLKLRVELGCQPVIFGAPDEIRIKLQIQSVCPEVFFAHGETIRHTAALIQRCSAFVSNDSALAHIASAMDVPVVMICGPTDPAEVGPYGRHGVALSAGLGCSPCFRVGRRPMCCTHPQPQACLKQISVEQVFTAAQRMLGRDHSLMPQQTEHADYRLPVLAGAA
jgi:heptosyltransferase-2